MDRHVGPDHISGLTSPSPPPFLHHVISMPSGDTYESTHINELDSPHYSPLPYLSEVNHTELPNITLQPLQYVAPVPLPLAKPPPLSCYVPFPPGFLIDKLICPISSCVNYLASSDVTPNTNTATTIHSSVTHLVGSFCNSVVFAEMAPST